MLERMLCADEAAQRERQQQQPDHEADRRLGRLPRRALVAAEHELQDRGEHHQDERPPDQERDGVGDGPAC